MHVSFKSHHWMRLESCHTTYKWLNVPWVMTRHLQMIECHAVSCLTSSLKVSWVMSVNKSFWRDPLIVAGMSLWDMSSQYESNIQRMNEWLLGPAHCSRHISSEWVTFIFLKCWARFGEEGFSPALLRATGLRPNSKDFFRFPHFFPFAPRFRSSAPSSFRPTYVYVAGGLFVNVAGGLVGRRAALHVEFSKEDEKIEKIKKSSGFVRGPVACGSSGLKPFRRRLPTRVTYEYG